MKIVVVMEDSSTQEDLIAEHGLCLYIETEKHHILADTGASDRTWENALKLGIPLEETDLIVLSHGHYDHSGGILGLRKWNQTARILMQESAFGEYYHGERYIGIDPEIRKIPSLLFTGNQYQIDEELSLFSNICGRRYWPKSNLVLSERKDGELIQDHFGHEQCLVIESEGKRILISGCAHNGILNILDTFRELYQGEPDYVISGFHMMKKEAYTEDEAAIIRETARELSGMHTEFYTGHCTGQPAFDLMKEIMKGKLHRIYSGKTIL